MDKMSSLYDVRAAGSDLRVAHAKIAELANRLILSPCRTKAEREQIGRELNAANVRVNTALMRLGQYREGRV